MSRGAAGRASRRRDADGRCSGADPFTIQVSCLAVPPLRGPMLLALVAAMLVQAPPAPRRILIRDVTIVSSERKAPLRHGYVVLENDRIAAVGQGTPPTAHWDSVVPGRGRVLIPGLIDGHTHLASPVGMPLPVPPELRPLAAAYAEQLPRSYLYSGFTTVVDLIV